MFDPAPLLKFTSDEEYKELDVMNTPILAVDDLEDNLDLLKDLLEEKGFKNVLLALSGQEALEIIEREDSIGLVLLDLMMPGMDGYETSRLISRNEKSRHIPIIVVTGGALRRDEALLKSFECGAMDFIPKPVNEVELFGRVKSALMLFHERVLVRQKTRELEESQKRYDLAINGVNDGIWDIDLITNQVYYSPKWKEILGFKDDELPNQIRIWEELIHPEDKDMVLDAMQDHWNQQTPFYSSEHRLRTKDGSFKSVYVRGKAIWDIQGNVVRMVGSMTDITPRRKLEKQLRQAQQMESIGRLSAGVAHDFNNLLTAILGHVKLGKKSVTPNSPTIIHLNQIERASVQAAEFCKQLLAYSGEGRYSVEEVDLNPLLQETIDLLSVSISKKITLKANLSKHAIIVEGDQSQLRQVALNLLINAAEAIGDDAGQISIQTGTVASDQIDLSNAVVAPDVLADCEFALLEVTDSGCGISEEDQKKIFDPFFTTKFTGRGLGLSAVIGIIKANKGVMKISSSVGHGTTFALLFPKQETPQEPAPSPIIDKETFDTHWRPSGAILIVEDEEVIRELSATILQDMGYKTLCAEDGLEGLNMFREHAADIAAVILDLNMPNMNGKEAFDEIRKLDPEIPIILASGYSEEDVIRKFTEKSHNTGFLQKPFMVDTLEEKLRTFLKNTQ